MDAFDVALAVATNIGVPAVFIVVLGFSRNDSPLVSVMDAIVALLIVSAVALTAQWLALPRNLVSLLVVAWCGAAWHRARRIEAAERRRRPPWFAWLPRAAFAAAGAWIVTGAVVGHRPNPGPPVELAAPLPEGTWVAVNGGSTSMVNAHLRTLEGPAAPEWRGQSFAVDLVGDGAWGSRTRPVLEPRLDDFEIFGVPILAPCSGEVVQAADGEPDRRADDDPWRTRTGNHVLLDCDGVWVLLAHMSEGSVRARPGDPVTTGDTLGRVGNTGASGEPHLHVHAQTPGSLTAPFSGLPLPITLDGHRLVRHDRLRTASAPAEDPPPGAAGPAGTAP